jgi:hypothetical protein
MIWAFVDYENVGSLERLPLKNYDRVIVFFGPNNQQLKFGEIPVGDGCRMQIIKLQTQGKNNLDFHLVFQLGRFHETVSADIEFHLVSNDNGMNGILEHLKTLGRSCKKMALETAKKAPAKIGPVRTTKPAQKQKHHIPPSKIIAEDLKSMQPKHRPGRKTTLLSWIKNRTTNHAPGVDPNVFYAELLQQNKIREDGSKVAYVL